MMSSKDYILLAAAIKPLSDIRNQDRHIVASVAENLAEAMKNQNPRFSRTRFMTACGFPTDPESPRDA